MVLFRYVAYSLDLGVIKGKLEANDLVEVRSEVGADKATKSYLLIRRNQGLVWRNCSLLCFVWAPEN